MADNPMLKFVGMGQVYPEKRGAEVRAEDFAEIYRAYAVEKA